MNYPLDLEEKIEDELIRAYGVEWGFMMGSSFEELKAGPRRVYWATMSTHVLYDGGYSRSSVDRDKGYLKIVNAEKHYSFNEAVNELISKMRREVGGQT